MLSGKAIKTSGQIYVNGEPVNDLSRWKKLVGFVPQEDVMIRQLTVRDNMEFSANIRLGVEMSASERKKVVNDTLVALGIDHVQHSVIGDERQRGVSGGQRKRVNIGIELVALPKVLFLDEVRMMLNFRNILIYAAHLWFGFHEFCGIVPTIEGDCSWPGCHNCQCDSSAIYSGFPRVR